MTLRNLLIGFVFTIACAPPVGATTLERLSFQQLAMHSSHVVRGSVVSVKSMWTEDRSAIYSVAKFRVTEKLRGRLDSDEIAIFLPGGTVGDVTMIIVGSPDLGEDADIVLMLRRVKHESAAKPQSGYRLVGLSQGVFDVAPDAAGVKRAKNRAVLLLGESSEEVAAFPGGVDGMTLEELRRFLSREPVVEMREEQEGAIYEKGRPELEALKIDPTPAGEESGEPGGTEDERSVEPRAMEEGSGSTRARKQEDEE